MPEINANVEIQKMLLDSKLYDGPLDGKFGLKTHDAIDKFLKSKNVRMTSSWTKQRKAIAVEQLLYMAQDIEVGAIDGLVGPMLKYAREQYEAKMVTNWRDKVDAVFPPKTTETSVKLSNSDKRMTLADINPYQLAFIRGIGETETGFRHSEAYSEQYNKSTNNSNVRQYGDDGADYGYYQNNNLDVKQMIAIGIAPSVAKHLNGGGKNGKSTIEDQTIAMHLRLQMKYKDVYENLKSGSNKALEAAISAMQGHWFGLKDRPALARAEFKKGATGDWTKIFPEAAKSQSVKSSSIVWPSQNNVQSFFGNVGTRQVMCEVPFEMVLAWDTKTKLKRYSCHELVKEPMERIWNRTLEHYGYDKIVQLRLHHFGGCLNVRKMRGGSGWSMHSWGIAVDIDPDRNTLTMNSKQATMSKSSYDKFWEFVYDEGAISLGKERDYDWMHWQFSKL
jgi:hypothetical protein